MNRKNVDYGYSSIQMSEFAIFRRKPGEQTPDLTINPLEPFQFHLTKQPNAILLAIMMADLLLQGSTRSKTKKTQSIPIPISPTPIFKDFQIENVPKVHYNYQHEATLEQLLQTIYSKVKVHSLKQIHELVTNYSVTEFVLNCYARRLISKYISSSASHFDLFGNEEELLLDYAVEIRGQLLEALARACRISVRVFYRHPNWQSQVLVKEFFGDSTELSKLEIWDLGESYKVSIKSEEKDIKLMSTSSYQNISHNDNKVLKESASSTSDLSTRLQSNSAQKEIRCEKCNSKGMCQCEKPTGRRMQITRLASTNLNSAGNQACPRSIFDSVGLGGTPKRQVSIYQVKK